MGTGVTPLLIVEGLRAGYGEIDILEDVDLVVGANEIISIIGPNGAGKSTLLRAIMGYVTITKGHVRLDGQDLGALGSDERARLGMGYVPQLDNVFPSLSVRENMRMGGYTLDRDTRRERTEEMYRIFPKLLERQTQGVSSLSGGERQMLALARALMTKPRIMLLDEPSAALSPRMTGEVFEHIEQIRKSGCAVVIVEQEARGALDISDRGYVLANGRNAFSDRADRLLANDKIREAYLGMK
jgi:ABC-type branched-subunit amino acid transport system ATPase component